MKKKATPNTKTAKLDWGDVHNEAWEYKKKGKLKKAKEGYYKAIEIHPNYASYHNLGEVYAAMGDREKAIVYFNKSLEIKPEYALAYNNKAFSHYILKQYDLALESINKALEFKKQDGIINATKAEILFAMDDKEGFYKAFETCVHLGVDPTILDPAIKKKYGKERHYQVITGELKEEEINSPILKGICKKIESWDAIQINEAITLLKNNKEYSKIVEERYGQIYKNLGGKTLRSLAGFIGRWHKLNNIKKCNILAYWPVSVKFPLRKLNLSGTKRVGNLRDTYYGGQIDKFPIKLNKIKGITMVHLWHQQLKEVPDFVYEMKDLEVLDMRDNNLNSVSDKLLKLKKLKELNFDYNNSLAKIPDVGQLKDLEELHLQYTNVDHLSDSFFELKKLNRMVTTSCGIDTDTAIIKRIMTTFPDLELISLAKEAVSLEENTNPDEYKGQEEIKLREFSLNYLPKSLFNADTVKELQIDCYHLKELPDTFDNLQTLEILKIEVGSHITIIPDSITRLKNLKELHIESWNSTTLPENLGNLKTLEKLYLSCNNLEKIPSSVFTLNSLTHLEIKESMLLDIPADIKGLINLKTLHLKNIFQLSLDASIRELTNLEEVIIEIKTIESFDSLYKLPKTLKELTFYFEKLRRADDEYVVSIGELLKQSPALQKLNLKGISILSDEDSILENTTLKNLFIDGEIQTFPEGFGNLKALTNLTLFNSKLEALDASLYNCTNLAYCRINNINFSTIPKGIAKMKKLIWFGFESDKMKSIPEDIFELQQLERLILGDSPLFNDKAFKTKIKRKIKGLKVNKSWY